MELNDNETPDGSSHSEKLHDNLDTTSDCHTSDPSFQQYPFREFRQSIFSNNNYSQRTFEDSLESSQGNYEHSKKLNSISNSYTALLQAIRPLKDPLESSKSEMKEQKESLAEMRNNWDRKWDQASAAYKNIHSTMVSIKNVTEATANKVDENTMQFEGFLKNDVPKLKQISDECAANNAVIELKLDRNYGTIKQGMELCGEMLSNANITEECARDLKDIQSRVRSAESTLDSIKMKYAKLGVQPSRSLPTSPNVHYNNKACITPFNNSFQRVDSSHAKVDEKSLESIHFISKCTSNGGHSFQKKPFSDKLLKENTPPFCIELEAVNENSNSTDGVSTCHNTVSKSVSFNNNLSGPESEIAESRVFHEEAKKIPQTTACNDLKAEPDQTKAKLSPVPDETAVIHVTTDKNEISNFNLLSDIKDSSSYDTNNRAKLKNTNFQEYENRPGFKNIFYEKSIPKLTVPHSMASIIKKHPESQNGDQQDKEEHSQTNVLMSATALDDCTIFTNNEKNVSMSENYAIGIHEKFEEGSPGKQSIYNEQPNNSKGKAISQRVAATPNSQRPPTRQNQCCKSKKHDSKADIHFSLNVLMSSESATVHNSASIPSTRRGIGPYYLRSKDPAKRIKMKNGSSQQLEK